MTMRVEIEVLGEYVSVPCAAGSEQRLADLAGALDARVRAAASAAGETDARAALVIAALSLLDDAQQSGAALAGFLADAESRFEAAAARVQALAMRI